MVVLILISHGYYPTWYWLQVFYYFFAMVLLTLGLSWITSAVTVFTRDVKHIVTILLQFGFWATPILWNPSMLPDSFQFFVKLNPMAYIVMGFRDSLVFCKPFWEESLKVTLYFWGLTFFFLFLGIAVFKRLRPHFADVI